MRRLVNEAETPGDFDLNFDLSLGTERHLEVIPERESTAAARALADVGRNRDRSSLELRA